MNAPRHWMTVAGLALLGAGAQAVQSTQAVGALANPDQRGSARVMGMDASYVGVAQGADALQWNAAGLGHLASTEAGWNHLSGLGGAVGETIILGAPVGSLGGLALSAEYLDNGRFETRDSLGNETGSYDATTIGGSLGWGIPLMPGFAAGAMVRGSRQTLGASHYNAIAGEAGVLFSAIAPLTLGAAVTNLGSSGSDSSLAMGINLGASWNQPVGEDNHVLLAAATELQPGGLSHLNLGVEGTMFSRLALRAGYRMNFTDQKLAGLSGLTAGVGIAIAHLALDYAYLPFGDLGNLHRISLTFRGSAAPVGQAIL